MHTKVLLPVAVFYGGLEMFLDPKKMDVRGEGSSHLLNVIDRWLIQRVALQRPKHIREFMARISETLTDIQPGRPIPSWTSSALDALEEEFLEATLRYAFQLVRQHQVNTSLLRGWNRSRYRAWRCLGWILSAELLVSNGITMDDVRAWCEEQGRDFQEVWSEIMRLSIVA